MMLDTERKLLLIGFLFVASAITLTILYLIFLDFSKKSAAKVKLNSLNFSPDKVESWVVEAELKIRQRAMLAGNPTVIYISWVMGLLVGGYTFFAFKNIPAGICVGMTMIMLPRSYLNARERKRVLKVNQQLHTALGIFYASYLGTQKIDRALKAVVDESPQPVSDIFLRLYKGYAGMSGGASGTNFEKVLSTFVASLGVKHGILVAHLLTQLRTNAQTIELFADVRQRLGQHIELSEKKNSSIAAERVTGLLLGLSPYPVYYFMSRMLPEIQEFVTSTLIGKVSISLGFGCFLVWAIVDVNANRT